MKASESDLPDALAAFVEEAPWRFAKTMPHIPHSYVTSKSVPAPELDAFLQHLEEHGFRAKWRKWTNVYLEADGYRYWALPGRGDASVTILNREQLPGQPLDKEEPDAGPET